MEHATHSVNDIERNAVDDAHLNNTTVQRLAWRGICVQKKGWTDARPTPIISKIDGHAEAGTPTQQKSIDIHA